MKGFISIVLRAIINVESLSGVETVGNLSRHRTAPIVIKEGEGYNIRFLPVLSGESLAHYYQELLVEEAKAFNLPVSKRSLVGEFLKFTDNTLLEEEGISIPKSEEEIRKVEAEIISKDIVCDVGGFLYAGATPVKRTSCFQVGYAIPAIYDVEAAALEAQFHMRFAPSKMKDYQMPYNVEVGSAVYTFTTTLNIDNIGKVSTKFGYISELEKTLLEQREKRVKAALNALVKFYSYLSFGAKRSRFLPNIEPLSAIATYSPNSYFIASPGNSKNYIKITKERRDKFIEATRSLGDNIIVDIAVFDKEDAAKDVTGIEKFETIEELMKWLVNKVLASK